MKKVFFLDRDGVIIHDGDYLKRPEEVVMFDETPEAFRMIKEAGYDIVVVSNQSGIARGYFTEQDLSDVEKHIESLLRLSGAPLPDKWCYCPHHEKGTVEKYAVECNCRKPKPGMLLSAKEELNIDCSESFMIGDRISDIKAGYNAGCKECVMVLSGWGKPEDTDQLERKPKIASGILEAVKYLLGK